MSVPSEKYQYSGLCYGVSDPKSRSLKSKASGKLIVKISSLRKYKCHNGITD